jgi:hypothetical protein
VLGGTVTLAGNARLMVRLVLLSVPWMLVSCVGIGALAQLVRPQGWTFTASAGAGVALLAGLLLTIPATLVLHEAVHGLVFWAVTRSRPVFGFKGWYLYTDAPGWYLRRGQMLAALAAPLLVFPAVGLPVVAIGPAWLSTLAGLGLVVNAFGAIGDVYLMWVVARVRGPVLFGDTPGAKVGEAGSWFVPAERQAALDPPATT